MSQTCKSHNAITGKIYLCLIKHHTMKTHRGWRYS